MFIDSIIQIQLYRLSVQQFLIYSGTWELGTPKWLSETVLNSEVVLFLRFISM